MNFFLHLTVHEYFLEFSKLAFAKFHESVQNRETHRENGVGIYKKLIEVE